MKLKLIFIVLVFLTTISLKAQVGVGNTNPQATLDISASSTASPTNNDGILIPRMSSFPSTPGASRDGMLIFYTGISASGKGFYYWDQPTTSWIFLSSGGKNTLDEAYDEGGLGAGRTITASNGAVLINGNDGFQVTGTRNFGATLALSGGGTKMFFYPRKAAFRAGLVLHTQWDDDNIGDLSTAFGGDTTASGDFSTAFGSSTTASGTYSTALGFATTASGNTSYAFGFFTTASGTYSTALGRRTEARSYCETAIGTFNNLSTPVSEVNFNSSDKLFSIGNGTSAAARGNALTIYKSGLMNINDEYNMPLTDGSNGQIMQTNGLGVVSWVTPTSIDYQTIDNFSLSGTTLLLSLENDGQPLQTVNLASINTDDQNLVTPTLVGTTLNLNIENGTGTSIDLAPLQDGTGTDDQNIQNLSFNAATNVLTVGIENGISQNVSLASLATGGDIQGVTAGAGLTGGGTSGTVTVNAAANNGLNVDAVADNIQLGGPLVENTTITQGIYSLDLNLDSTGDFSIQDNGTDVFFVEDTGDIGIGTSNPAYPLHIVENVAATTYGVYIDKADNSTSQTSGLYIQKTGTGTGRSHAIFTNVDGAGTGQKYGIFNNINSSANGNQYGTRNFINGSTSSFIFGTFNNLDNAGTGNQYGVYNGMRGIAAANLYGTYNEFNSPSITSETAGVYNSFSDGTPGASGMMGVYSEFSNPSNGTYYGLRNAYTTAATGTGIKYGTYNLIPTAAGGTHYGTYNSVGVANGWAGYFVGKAYIANKLGIGTGATNPDGFLEVRANNTGTEPNINLVDIGTTGARINFTNTVTTNGNVWTLYGDTDNTDANSVFNIFHTNAGNIIEVFGDRQVEINGQLSVNLNNPTFAIHLPNNASAGLGQGRANAWTTYSDNRVKSNQSTIEHGLKDILKMVPKSYFHHNSSFEAGLLRLESKGEHTLGFIAQELYKVLPEAVQKPEDEQAELWSINYDKVVPVVVKAIQELNDKIERLTTENQKLNEQLSEYKLLEARLSALESEIEWSQHALVSTKGN